MNIVLIYGPPAAGKLTVASELARLAGYKLLDNHKVIDYLSELLPRSEPSYTAARSALGRRIRLDVFGTAALVGLDLVATFAPLSAGAFDFIRDVKSSVEQNGGTFVLVQLQPEMMELEKRVQEPSRKNRKIDTVSQLHEFIDDNVEALQTFPDFDHLVVDNTHIPAQQAALIIYNSLRHNSSKA